MLPNPTVQCVCGMDEARASTSVAAISIAGKFPTNLCQHLKKVHPSELSELSANDDKEKQEKEKKQSAQQAASMKVSHQLTLAESQIKEHLQESDRYRQISRKLAIFVGNTNVATSIVDITSNSKSCYTLWTASTLFQGE